MKITREEFSRLTGGRLKWPMSGKTARFDNLLFRLIDGADAARRQETTVLTHALVLQCLSFEQLAALGFSLISEVAHRLHLYCAQESKIILERETGQESRVRTLGDRLSKATEAVGLQIVRYRNGADVRRLYARKQEGACVIAGSMIDWPLYGLEELLGDHAGHCLLWSYCMLVNTALDEGVASLG